MKNKFYYLILTILAVSCEEPDNSENLLSSPPSGNYYDLSGVSVDNGI